MTAGGKRKGAGRPALPASEQAVAVTVRVRPSVAVGSTRWLCLSFLSDYLK